jgi:pilus assembly protein CpaC
MERISNNEAVQRKSMRMIRGCIQRRAGSFTFGLSLSAFVLLSLGSASSLHAQQTAPPTSSGADPQAAAQSANVTSAGETLHVLVGRSLLITSPTRVKRLSIADPNVADAIIISPTQIMINGKSPGGVSLVLWNDADQSQPLELLVDLDILGLSQKIHEVFPHEDVKVEAIKDVVVVSGHISSKIVADRILAIVSAAVTKVVNMMEVPVPPAAGEILLEVKFAEVNRTALSQLGVNLFSQGTRVAGATSTGQYGPPSLPTLPTGTSSSTGGTSTTSGSSSSTGAVAPSVTPSFSLSSLLNIFLFDPNVNVGLTIQALEQRSLLQTLAEPNLLTETGKEASFLAGGEFPFPVVQGGASGSVPTVTIQFREYGVKLTFTPTLTEGNRIHLHVRPEVSSLDYTNAITLSGFFIPALSTRRVDAEMELADGQSFGIAGLVDNSVSEIINKMPVLGDLPVLGQLFRSKSFQKSKDELVVIVTPHIVHPLGVGQEPKLPDYPVPYMKGSEFDKTIEGKGPTKQ